MKAFTEGTPTRDEDEEVGGTDDEPPNIEGTRAMTTRIDAYVETRLGDKAVRLEGVIFALSMAAVVALVLAPRILSL